MSVLTLCRDGSIVVGESEASVVSAANSIADDFGYNIRPEITPPIIEKVRTEKITRIRQQLARGTYDLDERLDAVLERILMDITP